MRARQSTIAGVSPQIWRVFLVFVSLCAGCARVEKPPPSIVRQLHRLEANDFWRLELPDGAQFDASGLLADPDGMLVIGDAISTPYRIVFGGGHSARLERADLFTMEQLSPLLARGKRSKIDFEGLARDEAGRIYVCEERDRWVLRLDPKTRRVEQLQIDWTPVREHFNTANMNASFEGIAVGGGKIWVANERERARIIEVDAKSLKIVGDFAPQPSSWGLVLHYSDLAWFEGRLYVLLRHHKVILELDPRTRAVLAEFDYRAIEEAPEHDYRKQFPTGTMEGLAVDANYFWMVTDNNGLPRRADSRDRRPTLFRCARPR